MIDCPKCLAPSSVVDSRHVRNTVRRRRECTVCKTRWTTYEATLQTFATLSQQAQLINNSLNDTYGLTTKTRGKTNVY